jgi:branched-chain amino acid transport system permease protein
MSEAIQFLMSGLMNGAIYGLAALAIVLVFKVSGVVNLAQGELITLGALVTVHMYNQWHTPLWVAAIGAILFSSVVSAAFAELAIRPAQKRLATPMTMIFVTLALSVLGQGIAYLIGGSTVQGMSSFLDGGPIRILDARLSLQSMLVIVVTGVVALALAYFFKRTLVGTAMSACADNPIGARSVGISVRRMSLAAFATAGALGGLSGFLLIPVTSFTYQTGFNFGMQGLAAAAIVGMRSPMAALGGGLAIGCLGSFATGYLSSTYQIVFVSLALSVALLAWPKLLGRQTV